MIFKNMTFKQSLQSKTCQGGYGLIALGLYVMLGLNMPEFGFGIIMNGYSILGIRDKQNAE